MKLARVRHRVMASLVDLAVVASFIALITIFKLPVIISGFISADHGLTLKFIVDIFRWGIITAILMLIYYVVVPVLSNGQTLGKKVFKLKMVKEDGSKVDYRTLFYREGIGRVFINFASLGVTVIASILIMMIREDKKDLADILAKTKVIDLYESEEE